jgi:hypothetical protein
MPPAVLLLSPPFAPAAASLAVSDAAGVGMKKEPGLLGPAGSPGTLGMPGTSPLPLAGPEPGSSTLLPEGGQEFVPEPDGGGGPAPGVAM